MTVTEQSAPTSGRDTYVGGLDGLRAIAVAAVIVFHFAPTVLPGGFLGVDVFFVVSGFLISRLVVREIAGSGTLSRRDFWARRARRLLPALATVTVVVLIAAVIALSDTEMHDLRAQALGTLFYCANWVIIHQNGNYFATLGRPSPFLHMWTLAVEEQFYIVLPLVFFATRRALVRHPVRASVIALIGAVASTIWMAVLFSPTGDPTRAYIGTDSHAMGLLVGVALGVLAGAGRPWEVFAGRVRANRTATRMAPVLAAAALIVILVTMRVADDHSTWLFRGGFLVFAVLCALIVAVLVSMPDAGIARVLRTPALVAIGVRSYSLYLWHWPVRVFVTPSSGLHGAALFAVRLAISIVLAEISYRLIEQPFRVGAFAQKWGSRGALTYFGALTVVAAALVMTVAAPAALPPSTLAQGNPPADRAGSSQLRVDLFGDSTGLVFGLGGRSAGDQLDLSVGGDAQLGCGLVQADHITGGQVVKSPSFCRDWVPRWQAAMRNDPKARLAVMAGAWEVFDQKTATGVVRFGTPAWTDLITASTRRALDVLTADGRTVYLFEVPCYGAGDGTNTLMTERGDPKRVDAVNAIFAKVAHEVPHVEIVHWRTLVCPGGRRADKINGVDVFLTDQQHLTNAGAVEVWKWWLPQLRVAR